MRNFIFLALTLVLVLGMSAQGRAMPVVVQDNPSDLFLIHYENGSAMRDLLNPDATIEYNNMGYRTADGKLYALQLTSSGNTQIVQMNSDGSNIVGLGRPSGLPSGVRFDAGDFNNDLDVMYISVNGASGQNLYILDLSSWVGPGNDLPAVTIQGITGGEVGAVNDWAYRDGLLFGGDLFGIAGPSGGQLAVLNPATGVRTDYDVSGLPEGQAFGAAWYDPATPNSVFLYRNNDGTVGDMHGNIYKIDVSDLDGTTGPSILKSWTAFGTALNDGALVPIPGAVWLLGSGLIGLVAIRRRLKS